MSQAKSTKSGKRLKQKFIFVTGGVVSSIGKGLTAASLGSLLEARGFKVTLMKFDPYLNVDPGTMSPFQHGEVYVTDDGAETDLDLGHYERFTNSVLQRANSVSAGQIYDRVISRERRGDYLGGTVQVIPHITDEIKSRVYEAAQGSEIAIVEIGGTVGDIEAQPFFEAIRQMRLDLGVGNTALVHVTYVPYIAVAGELKSKPTQHSVKELREIGLQPDFLICRSEKVIDDNLKSKIGLFCSIKKENVISAKDSESIYDVPLALHKENLDYLVVETLNLKQTKYSIAGWQKIAKIQRSPLSKVKIAVVGKYVDLKESYKSLHESLVHGGLANRAKVEIIYIDSDKLTAKNIKTMLSEAQGILVPGGFGTRGVEGKILAIKYAREKKIPFFGICFGMQLAAIEFARNVCGIADATSREFVGEDKRGGNIVIDSMAEQRGIVDKGGTMRLGAFQCTLAPKSRALKVYKKSIIWERHRHRFEFNNQYRDLLEKNGLRATGVNEERNLVEIIEIPKHPWFVAVQFHPEFKSKPLSPHPLFADFIRASRQK
ncbi:CTP synthase [Pseudobdellovibrio exovorus]|uniref:CTP synthase n=1 Tax=Pseudobdellovibrio exovorus JSS TaxID=1184267 RepID=M4V6E1_9BACT|nr:CTP synthase [Pseudobdellovibrio exovorus]AGH94942.1 CTP synthetase [Pseudobdellovibrio exovorus JSS]